jgi:hypothetical protein
MLHAARRSPKLAHNIGPSTDRISPQQKIRAIGQLGADFGSSVWVSAD